LREAELIVATNPSMVDRVRPMLLHQVDRAFDRAGWSGELKWDGWRATAHGIETMALSRFTLKRNDVQGLLLGFAAFDERQIRRGLEGLAAALDRKQGEAAG